MRSVGTLFSGSLVALIAGTGMASTDLQQKINQDLDQQNQNMKANFDISGDEVVQDMRSQRILKYAGSTVYLTGYPKLDKETGEALYMAFSAPNQAHVKDPRDGGMVTYDEAVSACENYTLGNKKWELLNYQTYDDYAIRASYYEAIVTEQKVDGLDDYRQAFSRVGQMTSPKDVFFWIKSPNRRPKKEGLEFGAFLNGMNGGLKSFSRQRLLNYFCVSWLKGPDSEVVARTRVMTKEYNENQKKKNM